MAEKTYVCPRCDARASDAYTMADRLGRRLCWRCHSEVHGSIPEALSTWDRMWLAPLARPEYSPTALLIDVIELLRRKGVPTSALGPRATTATHAAADLLRALGVTPASAPMAPRRPEAQR